MKVVAEPSDSALAPHGFDSPELIRILLLARTTWSRR